MKTITLFLIVIAETLRQGDFPRIPQFEYSPEHEKYLFLGRPLTLEEFNEAAKRVFSPGFPGQGRNFAPMAIEVEVEDEGKAPKTPTPPAPKPPLAVVIPAKEPDEPQAPEGDDDGPSEAELAEAAAIDAAAKAAAAGDFTFAPNGKDIMQGDVRVAGLFGAEKSLRVPHSNKELRPALEAWLASQPA